MRLIFIQAVFVLTIGAAHAQSSEVANPAASERGPTVEYKGAGGRPLGSVTTIGGITYFADADGRPLGTAETIGDHRVYKSY